MPVIGFKALRGIIAKPAFGFAVDRDAVVIVKADQLAQSQGARQRANFMGNPFHQTAVAHKHPGVVVNDLVIRLVKLRRKSAFSNRQPDSVRQTLAERARGGLHARRIANLRVTRRFRMQLTEIFQLFDGQVVTGKMQQAVQQHRGVAVGQNKTVTVVPGRVGRVMFQEIIPQHFRDIRHSHWRAGMPRVGFLYGVHTECANGVSERLSRHRVLHTDNE